MPSGILIYHRSVPPGTTRLCCVPPYRTPTVETAYAYAYANTILMVIHRFRIPKILEDKSRTTLALIISRQDTPGEAQLWC